MMNLYLEFDIITQALEDSKVRYAVIGALAVGMYGHVRATKDVDLLIDPGDVENLSKALLSLGYEQRHKPWTFKESKMTLWRFVKADPESKSLFVVDALTTAEPALLQMIEEASALPMLNRTVRVVKLDHLIQLKRLRGATQDLADIEKLESNDA